MKPIKLEADIESIDPTRYVTFRAVIDESEPETVVIKITRARWDKWDRPTTVPLELFEEMVVQA